MLGHDKVNIASLQARATRTERKRMEEPSASPRSAEIETSVNELETTTSFHSCN